MDQIKQFLIFFVYAALIIIVAKYMMIYYIRKISIVFKLSTRKTGQIIGYATSVPELIGGVAAASVGMIDTSMFNIVSSNIINVVLFLTAVLFYRKQKDLFKRKFSVEYVFVIITILIPLFALKFSIQTKWWLIPIFVILYIIYLFIYRLDESEPFEFDEEENKIEEINEKSGFVKAAFYIFMLFLSLIILYLLGNKLSITLETLGKVFEVPELMIGAIMGVMTSLPELTSFFSSYSHHEKIDGLQNDRATVEAVNNLASSNVSNLFIIQSIALLVFMMVS